MNLKSFRSNIVLFSLLLFLLLTISVKADQVDEYVRAQIQERYVPGVSIAVIKDGKIVKAEGYGVASVEFNIPATKDTVF